MPDPAWPLRLRGSPFAHSDNFLLRKIDIMSIDKKVPGAIVLGGNFVGLGVVRCLGRRGIPVWVIDADRSRSIAQFSRYTKRFIEHDGIIPDFLIEEGRKHKLEGWVVFPVTDEYVEALSAHHELLSSVYRLTTGPAAVTKFALDKRLTYSRADELGIPTPWTLVSKSLVDFDAQNLPYPVILKPAVNHHFFSKTNIKALPAATTAELRDRYAQLNAYIPTEEILIQERIPGAGESQFSYCAACKDGRVYASLVAQRRRQYPVEFGNASSFVETTSQPDVEASGKQFLESIGFDGIGEVEFKFDSRDGKYKVLDFNARTWGWHTLGKAAGIEFVYLLWAQTVGLDRPAIVAPRQAAWLREITDIIAMAKSSDRVGEIRVLLNAMRSRRFELATFDLRDPIPFFAEFALWLSSGFSRQSKAKSFLAAKTIDSSETTPVALHNS